MASTRSTSRFKLLKVSIVIIVIALVALFVVQQWFTNNARKALTQYIAEQSNGNIQVSLSGLNLNLFSQLSLNVASVWALLINKKLLLDSVKLYNPVINVYQWRKDTTANVSVNELSIPQLGF